MWMDNVFIGLVSQSVFLWGLNGITYEEIPIQCFTHSRRFEFSGILKCIGWTFPRRSCFIGASMLQYSLQNNPHLSISGTDLENSGSRPYQNGNFQSWFIRDILRKVFLTCYCVGWVGGGLPRVRGPGFRNKREAWFPPFWSISWGPWIT